MYQTQINNHRLTESSLLECGIDPSEIGNRGQHAHVASHVLNLIEHFYTTEQLRHGTKCLIGCAALIGCQCITQRCERFIFNQATNVLSRLLIYAQRLDECLVDFGVTKLNTEAARLGLFECGKGRCQNVQIGFQSVRTNQLGTHLQKLALVSVSLGNRAKHLLAVIQSYGQLSTLQTGGCDARNGRGVVRTRHADASGTIDDLEHVFLSDRRVCLCKHVVILDGRCDDLTVSPVFQRLPYALLDSTQAACRCKQQIAGSLRGRNLIAVHDSRFSLL